MNNKKSSGFSDDFLLSFVAGLLRLQLTQLSAADAEARPKHNRCLPRNSEEEYCPYVIFEKKHIECDQS